MSKVYSQELKKHLSASLVPQSDKTNSLCKHFFFSDSVILISHSSSENSFENLMSQCLWLFHSALMVNLQLRGAITYGEIHENDDYNVYFGKGLTLAYDLEQKQQWAGALIDRSVEQQFPKVFKEAEQPGTYWNHLLHKYAVPMKDKQANREYKENYYTLNWRSNLIVKNGIHSLFPFIGDPNADQKVTNTLEFSKDIIRYKKAYYGPGRHYIPLLDPIKPKLFPHGDDL